jgi:hypothetical protein
MGTVSGISYDFHFVAQLTSAVGAEIPSTVFGTGGERSGRNEGRQCVSDEALHKGKDVEHGDSPVVSHKEQKAASAVFPRIQTPRM